MKENFYPLTAPQKSIYVTEQYFANTAINTICGYTFITDVVNFEMLQKAILEMVKSNDAMRLKLVEDKDSVLQYVSDFAPFSMPMVELATKEDLEKKALEMANIPFFSRRREFISIFAFQTTKWFWWFYCKCSSFNSEILGL